MFVKLQSWSVACFVSLCLVSLSSIAHAQTKRQTAANQVDVFSSGEAGYNVYRIPAIVQTAQGTLLAFCEAREGGDASEIDLVLKRSFDHGKTWGEMQVVCESDDYKGLYPEGQPMTLGNPAPVVDTLSESHAGRIYLPFTLENDRVFVTFSDDDGETWSEPEDITKSVKRDDWGWYATGPVHSIQIQNGPHRGRMVIACDHRLGDDGADKGPNGAHVVLSDDFGKTWRLGAIDATYEDGLNANETTVVELDQGVLYFNTRDQHGRAPGSRGEAFSYDGGASLESHSLSWSAFRPSGAVLDPPVVQSSLLRLSTGEVVFCGPDENGPTGKGRSDLRLRLSTDLAARTSDATWSDGPIVHVGPAAYSDLVEVNDGQLGILYECGANRPYEHIRFSLLSTSEFIGGRNAKTLLPRATPESQGVDSQAIIDFINAADQEVDSLHSFMLVRHGNVVAEAWWSPQNAQKPHVLWSLSKSFTSTAVGLACAEGKLSIDDRVADFFPELLPERPSANLGKMRVRDLLTMTVGHQKEVFAAGSSEWRKAFLAHEVPHKPGTHFQYNTPATYMLSAIVQKVTGQKTVDYLQPRLFEPLGIEAPRWDDSPEGISLGGYGLFLKTEDIAKFGQLLLQQGTWNGQQIVPAEWVKMATARQVSNGSDPERDWDQGYGFQFWRCRHNAFRGDGKDGQFCIVMPDQDAVVVMTANSRNLQTQLSLVWEHLLPAMQPNALPEQTTAQAALRVLSSKLTATR